MRLREKASPYYTVTGDGYSIVYDVVGHSPQRLDHQYPWQIVVSDGGARILDDPVRRWFTAPSGRKLLAFKSVDHLQWNGNFAGGVITYHLTNQGYNNCVVSGLDSRTHVYYPTERGNDISLWALGLIDQLFVGVDRTPYQGHYDRWQKCKPTMTTKANAAVFLAELRDIIRMIDILPSKHFRCNDWREVFIFANNSHLNYNFGWKPFLRDIGNFAKAWDSFYRRLNRFLAEELKTLKRSRRDSPIEGTREWTEPGLWGWTKKFSGSYRITRGSSFVFEYQLPKLPYNELVWRAFADSLGLHLSAKNFWALVPWSFVVDWFADISGCLSQLDEEWVDPWVTLLQACYTQLEEARVSARVEVPPSYGVGPVSGQMCTIDWRRFRRGIGTPNFTWDTQTLNSDKIRLLASLVASKVISH